jgi:hypothetical protein
METKRMTRLSATATIAALLLLAIVQGFGATSSTKSTKSLPKVATKSTAKPYHVTAQNQFHIKSTKHPSAAMARLASKRAAKTPSIGPHGRDSALAYAGRTAAKRTTIPTRTRAMTKPRRNQSNPPTGKIGFVSATQIPSGGYLNDTENIVLSGSLGTSTALLTVIDTGAGCAYSEVQANGDGTFTGLPASPATWTLVADPYGAPGDDCYPNFVFGDVNGDGNSDIVQADSSGATVTITVLLSNGDGTFTPAPAGLGPASGFTLVGIAGITGGTLVPNATSGFLDLWVVDDSEPSNLAQYAGNGDGTFTLLTSVGVSVNPPIALLAPSTPNVLDGVGFNVIIEDLDGDGTPDVVETDFATYQEAVYLSNQTTPYTGVELTTPDGNYDTCQATAGSLTGSSGLAAIVVTNCDDQTLTVYNNAAGVFSEGVYYPSVVTPNTNAETTPLGVTIADVNGDGNGDVIVTNNDSSDVSVLVGNGDGTLQLTSVAYAMGGYPNSAAIVTDLNGDGLADILVADDEFNLTWAAGFGDGTFQAARDYFAPNPENTCCDDWGISIASGDFNGDGFTDVVESNYFNDGTGGITVFLSNPDGSLQPGVNYGLGGRLEYVAVADFNGDGKLDIAATNTTNDSVLIFTGTGNGTFVQGPAYSSGGGFPVGIAAATFGTDTATDLAVINAENPNITILTNDGSAGFTPGVGIAIGGFGYELVATDLNGDMTPDLAVSEIEAGQVGVLLWDVSTSSFDIPEVDYPVGGAPYGLAAADVTGDGNVDLVATVENGGQDIALLTGNGDGTFNAPSLLTDTLIASTLQNTSFDSPWPGEVQIADVDGDGVPDLVYTNSEYGTVGVLFGTGTGTTVAPAAPFFFDPVEFPAGQYAYGVTVANITGDGTAAVVVADDDSPEATTMINGNGTAATPNFSLTVTGQSSPAFLNIPAGGTATAMITLTPINFYSGTVTFSCGGLPLDVTCAFAPATLTPVGNAPLSTTLTITTAASHGALRMPADANPHQGRTSLLACLTGMGLFGLLLSGDWKNKRNRRVGILLGLLVLGMMFSLVGCSSSSTPGTPIGAQTIQVTGTGSDGTTNSVNLTINVF